MRLAPSRRFSVDRMIKGVQDCRKDEVMIDFARQIGTRFAAMVAHFSGQDGNNVSPHNNKTLFLEGIDIWCRANFSQQDGGRGPSTQKARDVIEHVMAPWYEAMELDDPSKYRGSLTPPPAYVGDSVDATILMLGACACLEIQPLMFRFGLENGEPVHVWGRVMADGHWYDSDISDASLKLGQAQKFQKYEDVEIPL